MPESAPTAFPSIVTEQEPNQQGTAGLDTKTKLPAVWSQLEYWEDGRPYLKEYEGRGLLHDKKVLITGGDSGIGRSVAILMAREGADVTFVYLPEEEEDAEYTVEQIEKAGRKAQKLALNIREEANCQKAVDEHVQAFGRIDVLVNNSAMQEVCTDLKDIDLSRVEMTFRTNILSIFAMVKFALPHMQRGSSIVNSCSVAGYMGNPELVDYSSTKGGISALTRSLAQQQAPKGIRVNAVAPGIIWTPLQPATKGNPPEKIRGWERRVRRWGDRECRSRLQRHMYFLLRRWEHTFLGRRCMGLVPLKTRAELQNLSLRWKTSSDTERSD